MKKETARVNFLQHSQKGARIMLKNELTQKKIDI